MLAPIYQLLFGENDSVEEKPSLELTEDQVDVSYKTYKSDKVDDRRAIVDRKLAPGNEMFNKS